MMMVHIKATGSFTNMIQYTRYLEDDEFRYEIDSNGCWVWTGWIDNWGYGYIPGHGGAHRVSYQIYKGRINKGLLVCHTCDNPKCVNPEHLWLGTTKENALDRQRKGRGNTARGPRHGLKLHPERAARGDKHGSRTHPEALQRGENHWTRRKDNRPRRIKLDYEKADYIRESFKNNAKTIKELSEEFNVNPLTINRVINNQRWVR